MTNGALNRALYSGLDFDTINDDLRAHLQVKFSADFNDFALSSLGIMLLDLTAYGLDALSFYLDRRATDTYLATARTRKNVSRACRQLGYAMGGAVASAVAVDFTVNEVFAFDVSIPKGFQLWGPDKLIFEVAETTTITIAEQGPGKVKSLPCYEGETVTESFVSDGTPAQVFELRRVPEGKFVVAGAVEGRVSGVQWNVVDLVEYGATNQFEVGFNDDPPTVRFGDGVSGNIPSSRAAIDITYVASRGRSGKATIGTITSGVRPLVVAFTPIPLTISNPEAAVGGDDRETLSSAKSFAPKVWKSRQVAVVGEDYEALAGAYADPLFGRVAVAKAISVRSASLDLTVQNFLADIQDAVTVLSVAIASARGNITAALSLLDAQVTAIVTTSTALAGRTTTIRTKANTVVSEGRTIKNKSGEALTDTVDIQNLVVSGKAQVDVYGPTGTGDLTALQVATINNFFDLIQTETGFIVTAVGTNIPTAVDNATDSARDILTEVGLIGTDLVTLDTDLKAIQDSVSVISTESAAIATEVVNLDNAETDLADVVDASEAGINEHFDKILSSDCKANLISVPILTKDAGGFYAAPSEGLVASLQSYLDGKKEVTQTVSVTSGKRFLLPAAITVRVGVLPRYSEVVIKTTADSVVSGALRGRAFGEPLYESDLDEPLLTIEGVDFVNARITGHLDSDGITVLTMRLDSDGNLIPKESEIVTFGSVTIATESSTT
jgi:hypothetical protein